MSSTALSAPSRWMRRFSRTPTPLPQLAPSSLMSRIEVCPPQLWPSSLTLWGRMQRWLMRDHAWIPAAHRPVNRLALVKSEFQAVMRRVVGDEAARLGYQIDSARSLRELWHLRSGLYSLLAQQHDQADAERCMTQLNRHFPMRAPRPKLGQSEV